MQFQNPTTVGNDLFFVVIGGITQPFPTSPDIALIKQFNNGYQIFYIFHEKITTSSSVYSFIVNDNMNIYGFEVSGSTMSFPNVFNIEGTANQFIASYVIPSVSNLGFLFFSSTENIENISVNANMISINNFIGNDGYGNKSFGYVLITENFGSTITISSSISLFSPLCSIVLV
jgi:hypothetical protein